MHLGTLGPVELLLIVLAIMLIFGAGKLAGIGGALGKSVKDFRREAAAEQPQAATRPPEQAGDGGAPTERRSAATAPEYRPQDSVPS